MTTTDHKTRAPSPSANLLKLIVAEGFWEAVVWLQTDLPPSNEPSVGETKETKAKTATERQADQTVRDEDNHWKRCYAKAPDDPDARALVAMVAKAIVSTDVRKAIRLVIENPELALIGEKVRGLRGVRSWIVRWLIGAVDSVKA